MKGKVTVIDDDKDLRSLLQIALRIEGFEVIGYANGQEFLATIDDVDGCDFFVLDINLGGINGFELCQLLKKHPRTKKAHVILISANPEVQQLSADAKADDYLLKPFSQKELMQKINKLIAKKH
jgi:DNA-binding response OmpR family regulator